MRFRSFRQPVFSDAWRANCTLVKKSKQPLEVSAIASDVWAQRLHIRAIWCEAFWGRRDPDQSAAQF